MALDPESLLGTPAGYASPQQLEMARQLAAALIKPQQGHMQSWTQPASQIVNALLGAKMTQQAGASERSMAGAGLPLGGGSPLSEPGQMGPGPQGDLGGGLTRITSPSGAPFTVSSEHADKFQGLVNDLEAAGFKVNSLGGYNYRNIAGTSTLSQHAFQNHQGAIDIDPTGLPPDLARALAEKHGLTWGGDFKHAKPDPMHFEVNPGAKVADASTTPQMPQSPAGGPQQAPVLPPGGGPQPTPGASASPQMTSGSQPPPEAFRPGQLIQPNEILAARMRQDPHAFELEKAWRAQNAPQTMQWGDTTYGFIPGRPDIKPWVVPQPHQFKEFGGEGVPKYPGQIQQTPQGFVQSPVPMAGAPLGQPPAAAGGGGPAPSVGTGAQPPTDFASATQAAIDLKNREAEAQTRGQEDAKLAASQYKGRAGLADIAGQQKQNISALVSIVNDKNDPMISGPGANSARFFQRVATQFAPLFGKDPEAAAASPAASREVFEMLMKRVLADQFSGIRSLASETGEQGGRILKTFFDAEQGALPTAEDSLPGIRAKLNILDRAGDYLIKWGRMADQYKSQNKSLDPAFHSMMVDEMSKARLLPSGGGATSDFPVPPQGALEYLKANPNTRNAFEEKYGISAAERAVRGQ